MLNIYRNKGESFRVYNEIKDIECIVTLIDHNYPNCVLKINGEMQIKKIPDTTLINECSITILNIDRGVKFGLIAPRHILINRV